MNFLLLCVLRQDDGMPRLVCRGWPTSRTPRTTPSIHRTHAASCTVAAHAAAHCFAPHTRTLPLQIASLAELPALATSPTSHFPLFFQVVETRTVKLTQKAHHTSLTDLGDCRDGFLAQILTLLDVTNLLLNTPARTDALLASRLASRFLPFFVIL